MVARVEEATAAHTAEVATLREELQAVHADLNSRSRRRLRHDQTCERQERRQATETSLRELSSAAVNVQL